MRIFLSQFKGEQLVQAGSAFFYRGKEVHGVSANTTADKWRRGLYMGFVRAA